MKKFRNALSALFALAVLASPSAALAEKREFTLVTVDIQGVKIWLPSTITVKKGDQVRIQAISKVPGIGSAHGLTIEAFKIKEVADDQGKTIEFTANQAGIFPIRCHLHPPHIGAQLVVLE
jgi:nitrosocyanin